MLADLRLGKRQGVDVCVQLCKRARHELIASDARRFRVFIILRDNEAELRFCRPSGFDLNFEARDFRLRFVDSGKFVSEI